ncbi:MAG: winged helix-turn-helix transcriptional regulator [Anaerolineae bacterium]|nr:winged helix-turn-helix transcriptional regulator [Anaerolineae bacterium]
MTMDSKIEQDLQILEQIEQDPDITQADLAARLGVAVGSVNWYLKRLINKGHIKVRQMQRRRLRYLITPQGVAEKARLTYEYMDFSLRVYRELRAEAQRLLSKVQAAGYSEVYIDGDGDVAEICRLTCLERGVKVASASQTDLLPVLRVEGSGLVLEWAGSDSHGMSE